MVWVNLPTDLKLTCLPKQHENYVVQILEDIPQQNLYVSYDIKIPSKYFDFYTDLENNCYRVNFSEVLIEKLKSKYNESGAKEIFVYPKFFGEQL